MQITGYLSSQITWYLSSQITWSVCLGDMGLVNLLDKEGEKGFSGNNPIKESYRTDVARLRWAAGCSPKFARD